MTHRAFCDALAEENYKVDQNLITNEGILQNQVQEMFTSLMPTSDSMSTKSFTMNLIASNDKSDNAMGPLSLNSAGMIMSSKLNLMVNPKTSMSGFSSADVANSSGGLMTMGSTYTSATALLQKAAEMGAKISDNPIAPILYRGFAGYSTSGSLPQDAPSAAMGPTSSNANNFCVGDMDTWGKNMESGHPRNSIYNVPKTGLVVQSENMEVEGQGYMKVGERMTVDFLGVEPTGHSTVGKKRSYDGNIVGLEYSPF